MFQPVFVYDSERPDIHPDIVAIARRKGFRMVDMRDTNATVHGGNPAVVVYNEGSSMITRIRDRSNRFEPPENTGLMFISGPRKGHVHGLPDEVQLVEWFFDRRVIYWNRSRGLYRI